MNMSLRDLFLADDAHEVQDDELDEELKARWSLLGHALTGRGFMLEEPTIDALCNPWMSLVSAHYDPARPRITSLDRRKLERLRRALQEALKAVGPDPRTTAHLIGGLSIGVGL
jgi:hypothetical protein